MIYFLLIINIIAAFVYYYFNVKLCKQERVCRLVISLSMPFLGMILMYISDVLKRNDALLIDTEELLSNDTTYNSIKTFDRNSPLNVVPISEVLLVSDVFTKRKVLLNILKDNPDRHLKSLKYALDDEDTETSHYASSALTEIKRGYDLALQQMNELMGKNPEDMEIVKQYLKILSKLIEGNFLDEKNKRKQMYNYINILEKHLKNKSIDFEPSMYNQMIDYMLMLGELLRAEESAKQFIILYPLVEFSYFSLMKVYYSTEQRDKFKDILENLKNSNVVLSENGLSKIRLYLGKN